MKKSYVFSCLLLVCLFISSVQATIVYDRKTGLTVYYDASEDDQGLFEEPGISGDELLFSPSSFGVSAGGAGGWDFKDGTLNIIITAKPSRYIDEVVIQERGDYSLIDPASIGTSSTSAVVTTSIFFRIEAVNGDDLVETVDVNDYFTFSPSEGNYYLPGDKTDSTNWSGGYTFDVGAVLAENEISGRATRVSFSMDNKLYVFSEAGTIASIKKKQLDGLGITVIPEPMTLLLLGAGGLALLRRRR